MGTLPIPGAPNLKDNHGSPSQKAHKSAFWSHTATSGFCGRLCSRMLLACGITHQVLMIYWLLFLLLWN